MAQRIHSIELELGVQLYPKVPFLKSIQTKDPPPFFQHLLQHIAQRNDLVLGINPEDQRVYLRNGACVYADGNRNIEYSLPECASVRETIACEQAAGIILEQTAHELEQVIQQEYPKARVFVYKNNVARDSRGNATVSYGTHENYSLKKIGLQDSFWQQKKALEDIITAGSHAFGSKNPQYFDNQHEAHFPYIFVNALLLPFLATRPVLCGAGAITEEEGGRYEISQRAPFMKEDISSCTTKDRGLGNIRDEDHARNYHRIHIICGDANMLEYSTFLKLGTTGLLLRMIEEDALLQHTLVLHDPVTTHHDVSADTRFLNWYQVYHQGKKEYWTAIDIQMHYLTAVQDFVAKQGGSAEEQEILAAWKHTLHALSHDQRALIGKIDWVTKKYLLEELRERKNVLWNDSLLHNRSAQYHLLDRKLGIFHALQRKHPEWRIVPEQDVQTFVHHPPQTRAAAREHAVKLLRANNCALQHISWNIVQGTCAETKTNYIFALNDPFATQGEMFSLKEKEKKEDGKS